MASSLSFPCPKISSFLKTNQQTQTHKGSLSLPPTSNFNSKSCLSFGSSIRVPAFSAPQWPNDGKQTTVFASHTQLNEVAAEKSSNSVAVVDMKPKVALPEEDDKKSAEKAIPDAAAISEFMAQVSDLVKLVDSRDITELQLKQSDCELVIRKKEALQQLESASPIVMQQYMPQPRSPAPGEPPFVKVGDKVQKGQVVCIIEAMKLMNEIEADQSGTVTEILVEDGKPVSVDMPLFVIVG
ncbi:hypothetical protein GOBAR_AA13933 [Gossypium barbadense]|uniref:Biotin carboxyl carrier protein of acetyl-CoA carboxylase n=1 Tax=Gossypium barbadense TaxID=3634 RepID=A0A2P5XTP4_GOSBA|nr:hypothetical protein GOBAR_AA13933 [Gossypium barbadense]